MPEIKKFELVPEVMHLKVIAPEPKKAAENTQKKSDKATEVVHLKKVSAP